MSGIDEIYNSLPIDALAQQIGADRVTTEQAVQAALPALFGGLQANAAAPAGAQSILDALSGHSSSLLDDLDLGSIDTSDGAKIAGHIFGDSEDRVYNALGASSATGNATSSILRKLIPILAPIVMSYIVKQMQTGRSGSTSGSAAPGGSSQSSPGSLQDILGQVLGGAAGGAASQTQSSQQTSGSKSSTGSILTDILGGLLGGGR